MAPALSDLLVTDDLSILLALVGATLFLLKNLYKPQPLVHPILLGRQSDAARVRHPKESAIYRNYGTGIMGHFPVRPEKDINTLHDLVRSDVDAAHTLWSTKITNSQLKERAKALGAGLLRAGLKPGEDNVLLFLEDSLEFIISDLALAAHSIVSFTLSSKKLIKLVLDSHQPSATIVHAALLPHLLDVFGSNPTGRHLVVVVGEIPTLPRLQGGQTQILKFADIERDGAATSVDRPLPASSDVFSVAFYPSHTGKDLCGARLTHANIVAGVAAVRNLVPTSNPMSPLDTVVSMYPLSTPYGRSIAYTAIFEGCNFATLVPNTEGSENSVTRLRRALSADLFPIPPATLLFTDPNHLAALVTPILKQAQKSYLFTLAWRHKLSVMFDGFMTKDSLWDRLVFDHARAEVIKEAAGTLRTIICGGGPQDIQAVVPARIALSIPVVNTYIHGAVTCPIFASHPLDLQIFADDPASGPAHVGPPVVNLEVKLVGVDDEAIESGNDPLGTLYVRGPPVAQLLDNPDLEGLSEEDRDGWTKVASRATVQTNGTFKILEA